MVKILQPLMSVNASGTILQFLTFSKRNSGNQVRWQNKQKDVISVDRTEQRRKFLSASLACRFFECGIAIPSASVCGLDIEDLNLAAFNKPLTGYNLGIKELIDEF